MDIYHRFCVIVSLIQKQTNRIWELHYTLKITKPWNYLDHLAFTCLIAMVGTSTGHSILIVLWSPLAETATYIAYTQFWWQWQWNDLPPNLLGARPIQESATPSNVHPPPSPALPALLAPFILFCAAQHWGKLKISSQLKKKHVLGENLLQPPHLPHSTFNLPSSKKPPDTRYHGCNHLENRISPYSWWVPYMTIDNSVHSALAWVRGKTDGRSCWLRCWLITTQRGLITTHHKS